MRITVRGLGAAIERARGVASRARDVRAWASDAAREIQATAQASIASQTSPDGTAWPPVQRPDGAGPLGSVAGTIYASPGPRGVRFGASAPSAGYHQRGTRTMPRRAFLPVEWVGGRWVPMVTGRAGALWDSLRSSLERHLRGER